MDSDEQTQVHEQSQVNDSPKLVGSTLDGRYYIEEKLGSGGIGDVYLARDKPELMSRRVVVKVLQEKALQDEWIVTKFRQEIEALTRIDDPGVVGLLDAGALPNGHPYLVMQFVDGETLRKHMRPDRGMEFDDVARIWQQLGRTLTAAHENEVIHRDLKPENVMVRRRADGTWQVKVIDFGIAKIRNSLVAPSTVTGRVAGTVSYMAPEQLQGKKVSSVSDVYGLGVIAYEMVTGRCPYNPETAFQLSEMQKAGAPLSPRALRPALPVAAQDAILKALSYSVADRYQRARDFGDDLARALLEFDDEVSTWNKPTEVDGPPAVDAAGKAQEPAPTIASSTIAQKTLAAPPALTPALNSLPPRRRQRVIWLIALSLLLAVGLTGIFGWRYVSAPVEPERGLTYWLTVQRMYNSNPLGEPFEAAGRDYFHTGDSFSLNIVPSDPGALYLFSEGGDEKGMTEWNILFPTQKNNQGLARLAAQQAVKTGNYRFLGSAGVEKIWLVWASRQVPLLDSVFHDAFDDGVIRNPVQQEQLQNFLKQHEATQTKLVQDETKARALFKGRGQILVRHLDLSHKPS